MIKIYQKIPLTQLAGKKQITFDFGAHKETGETELLYRKKEPYIVEEAIKNGILNDILISLGINLPTSWIIAPCQSKLLIPSLPSDWKAGDVDIIAGNFYENSYIPSFNYILAAQVKMRKVNSAYELKSFPSGRGTKQAHFTAKMGFDRTILLHFIVKEPTDIDENKESNSWNVIKNSAFEGYAKACVGSIKNELDKENLEYGYGWVGWGQAFGNNWNVVGSMESQLIYNPPFRPFVGNYEIRQRRTVLEKNLKKMLLTHNGSRSIVITDPKY